MQNPILGIAYLLKAILSPSSYSTSQFSTLLPVTYFFRLFFLTISLFFCNIFLPYEPAKSSAHPEAIDSPPQVRCMATLS